MNFIKLITGWKSKAAGITLIGTGIATIGNALSGGPLSWADIFVGLKTIGAGLAVLGIAGKMEKQTDATLATSPVVPSEVKNAIAEKHGSADGY